MTRSSSAALDLTASVSWLQWSTNSMSIHSRSQPVAITPRRSSESHGIRAVWFDRSSWALHTHVSGDRCGTGAGVAGNEARQFVVVGGFATVLVGESLPCQGGSDLCPDVVVEGGVPLLAEPGVVLAVGHCHCPLKLGFAGAHGESAAQLGGFDGHGRLGTAAWCVLKRCEFVRALGERLRYAICRRLSANHG